MLDEAALVAALWKATDDCILGCPLEINGICALSKSELSSEFCGEHARLCWLINYGLTHEQAIEVCKRMEEAAKSDDT
jgi:hypothetical protein